MCGILTTVNVPVRMGDIEKALSTMRSRGPDSAGIWVSEDAMVWLGHRRLSIVDLSEAGSQPMSNEDGAVRLVCNGEIYNYPTLRAELEAVGHRFRSHSDNEAVIHAYEQWGEEFVDHLEGMFAFALWDERNQKLVAARDRLGIKPLYHFSDGGSLGLASSAGALLGLLRSKPEPDPFAVAYVMTLGYVPSPWTIWRGMSKLEPGHLLVWQKGKGTSIRRYWEPPREINGEFCSDYEGWHELFTHVLREHLLADVPIGIFLSAGIDSSSIAAGLGELGHSLQALTVYFPSSFSDELTVAEATARHLGCEHKRIPLEFEEVNSLIDSVARAYDEPQAYSALLTMWLISKAASRDFKVVLAGDGGDEIFGGYKWYRNLNGTQKLGARLKRKALRPLVRHHASPPTRQRAAHAFANVSLLHRHAWRLFPRFLPEEAEALLSPMGVRFADEEMLAPLKRHFEPSLPLKRALQRVDLMTFCSDSILAKVDRASMAHSLEVRVPFLDRRLVERFLPTAVDPREEEESKPLLREYLRPRVPACVLAAPKSGFSLRNLDSFDWDAALEVIGRGPWLKNGYWHPRWERLVQPGVPYREARIWTLLILTRWAEAWFR